MTLTKVDRLDLARGLYRTFDEVARLETRKRIGFRRSVESATRKQQKAAALGLESIRYLTAGLIAMAGFLLLNIDFWRNSKSDAPVMTEVSAWQEMPQLGLPEPGLIGNEGTLEGLSPNLIQSAEGRARMFFPAAVGEKK